ncbi:unnamed protein product [Aphanomyces euteiches]|uniref:Uncharacterized protein n=1 Tax=Aphanomyces euteiches TaxID=100861 RepID=A0A6G0XD37_9STRA|nr:hypothetical protein Ae201684_006067 [Aphanomyces euteiches]KAH9068702.1 hypothetical protein Ae201684P_004404 [Aphanomyces euteiches]KAH9109435.1 hypothetical protein AeMF1_015487 [Aphanomyces euteiches]KAH9153887.1 hypothetical protein AeRB84_003929 [Aphanomyces euteiches]KAH9188140.1 hypothetical protein AeNC1_009891 [Aphanomyces euteiches]
MSSSPTRASPAKPSTARAGSPNRGGGSPSRAAFALNTAYDDIKSSCGEQVDSRKRTAPTTCFGTSSRPKDPGDGNKSPGPGAYQVPTTIGKPVVSTIRSAPACSISGREKFGSTSDLKLAASCPGPGDYTPHIVNPNERNAPQFSLGKKWTKGIVDSSAKSPGPGAYDTPESLLNTRTVLSTSKHATASSFPKDNRKPLLDTSSADVGPGQYDTGNVAVGKQVVSTVTNSAAYSFSVVGRSKAPVGARMSHDASPAPNAYKHKDAVGTQVLSTYKSAPKCSMSGRTKFGSHF